MTTQEVTAQIFDATVQMVQRHKYGTVHAKGRIEIGCTTTHRAHSAVCTPRAESKVPALEID